MNGSTRTCISILNVFSLLLLLAGVAGIAFAIDGVTTKTTEVMIFELAPLLGGIVLSALLRGASEVLRLLAEINDKLQSPEMYTSSLIGRGPDAYSGIESMLELESVTRY